LQNAVVCDKGYVLGESTVIEEETSPSLSRVWFVIDGYMQRVAPLPAAQGLQVVIVIAISDELILIHRTVPHQQSLLKALCLFARLQIHLP
jgi:hypothetical protein